MEPRKQVQSKKLKSTSRGVTRNMKSETHSPPAADDNERMMMMHNHHQQTLWIYWMVIIFGVWLIMSPLTFDYGKSITLPAGNRTVWLSLSNRIVFMKWSDIISGLLLCIFGWRSLHPEKSMSLWVCCFIGIWLNIAPVLFWSPSSTAYLNDTLIGMMIISLTILIPGMPNMMMYMKQGAEVPQGWTYNPSSWAQRWIMIVTGFLGFIVSRYLAAFQLGYIDHVWDPFFDQSSVKVLTSSMSKSLPVSDAGLGALAYTFEFLMGFMGGPSRWRTMPWMVAFFGILVIPLGLVHIFLVVSQPLTVGAWCTFCIVAACIMLPMIPLEFDEVAAMIQHMKVAVTRGEKFWTVFWKGGQPADMNKDERTPEIEKLPVHFGEVLKASCWGMSTPWTLLLSAIIGIVILVLPGILNFPVKATFSDVNHLCGALIVVISVISMAEILRGGRYLNILLALAVAIIPWITHDVDTFPRIINILLALAVAAMSIPRGIIKERYGVWDKYIR